MPHPQRYYHRTPEGAAAHRLYNTPRWRALRRHQLMQSPICAHCWSRGQARAASVADHVVPHKGDEVLFYGGELQSLCTSCHNKWKKQIDIVGYSAEVGVDGYPVHGQHPCNRHAPAASGSATAPGSDTA